MAEHQGEGVEPINLLVEAVRVESIETTYFGQREPDVVAGPVYVVFRMADGQAFEIDWTRRGAPRPEVGTHWTLVPSASQEGDR